MLVTMNWVSDLIFYRSSEVQTQVLTASYEAQHARCKNIVSYTKYHAAFTNPNCRCSSEGAQVEVEVRLGWLRRPVPNERQKKSQTCSTIPGLMEEERVGLCSTVGPHSLIIITINL